VETQPDIYVGLDGRLQFQVRETQENCPKI